ncbi:hypothetical protein J6590_000112 [Homalodisca vitripennis]|nr:hypothetical protein J6590_000112 [Homalodisca vitripennis]
MRVELSALLHIKYTQEGVNFESTCVANTSAGATDDRRQRRPDNSDIVTITMLVPELANRPVPSGPPIVLYSKSPSRDGGVVGDSPLMQLELPIFFRHDFSTSPSYIGKHHP